ncbi:MAG: hypothetical protein FWD91_07730 [Treponema sp.]|nr:hypothetical protein [Treponema sp.]
MVSAPAFLISGCDRSSRSFLVTPPATHPLARNYIGFGVVNTSFTHLLSEPANGAASVGHLRRGAVLRIAERRQVPIGTSVQSWVFAEENDPDVTAPRGWLLEDALEIFDREERAITASRAMGP